MQRRKSDKGDSYPLREEIPQRRDKEPPMLIAESKEIHDW